MGPPPPPPPRSPNTWDDQDRPTHLGLGHQTHGTALQAHSRARTLSKREFAIQNDLLVTFMCNSAMSAVMHKNADVFWTALGRLKEFG